MRPRATATSNGWTGLLDKLEKLRLNCQITEEPPMQPHNIVSREEWIAARKAHLAHEKEFTQGARSA